jgi:hypothetical protein
MLLPPQVHPRFLVGSCFSIFSFMCSVLQIIVCPFDLFLLAIALSALLRRTVSTYFFGIFKRFLCSLNETSYMYSNAVIVLRMACEIIIS